MVCACVHACVVRAYVCVYVSVCACVRGACVCMCAYVHARVCVNECVYVWV
jgi:hypothetical protein